MKMDRIAAGTGLIALDVIIGAASKTPTKLAAGGTCGNVLTILSYLGWSSYPVARLGRDSASNALVADLAKWGVQETYLRVGPGAPAPIIIEHIQKDAIGVGRHRFAFHCPECGAWYPRYKPVKMASASDVTTSIPQPSVFFFDRVSRGALVMAESFAEKGALIVFEPSGNWDPRLMKEALGLTHVLKYANDRAADMQEWEPDRRPFLEVQTCGADGLRYRAFLPHVKDHQWKELAPYRPRVVADPAGSGDWCTAMIIDQLGSRGATSFKETTQARLLLALQAGQAAAAWNCGFEGPRGGMDGCPADQFKQTIERIMAGTNPDITETTMVMPRSRVTVPHCPSCRKVYSRPLAKLSKR